MFVVVCMSLRECVGKKEVRFCAYDKFTSADAILWFAVLKPTEQLSPHFVRHK